MEPITFEPGPLAEVSSHPSGDKWTLVFVRELKHAPDKVWAALTDPAQLRAWAPYTSNRDLGSTGPATLTMIDGDTPVDLPASVIRADAPNLLEYSWGGDVLRWELAGTGPGTRLTLHHTLDDREYVSKIAAGWHLCLVVADRLLDGRPIDPIRGDDARNYGWEALNDSYAQKLDISRPDESTA